MVEARDPRSVSQPGHLSRRIAGRGRGRARDVRQSAAWNRRGRGDGAGRAAAGAQCATRRAGARAQGLRLAMAADAPTRGEVGAAVARALAHRGKRLQRTAPCAGPGRAMAAHAHWLRCTLDRDLQSFASQTLCGARWSRCAIGMSRMARCWWSKMPPAKSGHTWPAPVNCPARRTSTRCARSASRAPRSSRFSMRSRCERRLLTPASLLLDTPLELPEERGLYRPLDYDRQFRGLVSMRTALASSLNVPAVRTAELVGVEALAEHLRAAGLREIVEEGDYYGASIALGSADVSLWNSSAPTARWPTAACSARCVSSLRRQPAVAGDSASVPSLTFSCGEKVG